MNKIYQDLTYLKGHFDMYFKDLWKYFTVFYGNFLVQITGEIREFTVNFIFNAERNYFSVFYIIFPHFKFMGEEFSE